jgi:hypothetical protein
MSNFTSFLFFLLPLFCLSHLVAQVTELSIVPNRVDKEVAVSTLDLDFEEISTIVLTNTNDREVQLQWEKELIEQPQSWETLVCSKTPNYAPFQNDASSELTEDRRPFRLAPGESLEFYLILRPNGETGQGRVKLTLTDITKPGRSLGEAVFNLQVSRNPIALVGNDSNRPKVLRIYPNPAVENFFVEVPSSKRLGRVEVVNTLGRKLKTFDKPAGPEGYDIDDLPEGIYLINIYDVLGNKLKTLRLFHRRFGA